MSSLKAVHRAGGHVEDPARREDGFVMVIVMLMMVVALAFGAAALAETLQSRSAATRNLRQNRALQAADAGVQAVLYQQNDLNLPNLDFNAGPLGLSSMVNCVVPTLNVNLQVTGLASTQVNTHQACGSTDGTGGGGSGFTGIPVGNNAYYDAEFIPGATAGGASHVGPITLAPKIVSVGYDSGGSLSTPSRWKLRRVEAILAPVAPFEAVEAQGNLKFNGLLGLTATLNGNARADGSVTTPLTFLNTDLSGSLIGSVTYGTTLTGPLLPLSHTVQQAASVNRQVIAIAPTKPDCANSSNVAVTCSTVISSGYSGAANDRFSLSSGSVSFPPGDYVFCSFNVTGGTVQASSTTSGPVRIFIDNPNSTRCAADKAAHDPNIGNFIAKTGVGNALSGLANATGATGLQIYVVGDGGGYDNATTVEVDGSFGVIQSFIIYAPTSTVTATAGCLLVVCTALQGAVIGDDVTINALLFTQDLNLSSSPLSTIVGVFHVAQYIECSPPTAPTAANTPPLTGNPVTDLNGC